MPAPRDSSVMPFHIEAHAVVADDVIAAEESSGDADATGLDGVLVHDHTLGPEELDPEEVTLQGVVVDRGAGARTADDYPAIAVLDEIVLNDGVRTGDFVGLDDEGARHVAPDRDPRAVGLKLIVLDQCFVRADGDGGFAPLDHEVPHRHVVRLDVEAATRLAPHGLDEH